MHELTAPHSLRQWHARIFTAPVFILAPVLLALIVSEMKLNWIERIVGAYLVAVNDDRPESGAIWEKGRKTQTARMTVDKLASDREAHQRLARNAGTLNEIASALTPGQGAMLSPLTGAILWGWGLTIIGTIHLMFLPSILPHILEGFQLSEQAAITSAGTIMMVYMAAAFAGNYLLVGLASRMGIARIITVASLAAALLQGLLYFSGGVYSFTVIRVLQAGVIAAVIPLVISTFAGEGRGGTTLGFLNSGRFVGNALGPLMATTILAQFGLLTLYLTIAGLTVVMLGAFLASMRKSHGSPNL